jgi:hypothetical protein
MREELAEQLLLAEMNWDIPTAKEQINKLRYLTAVKYDNYRNFGVGKRFLESLVLWLRQFKTVDERKIAYDFIMKRLLYISEAQMDHLVDLAYSQRILPILLQQTVESQGFSKFQIRKIRTSKAFKEIKRKSLFLGMSDGARMDAFRRKHNVDNEQVSVSYELSEDKWKKMQKDLYEWMKKNEMEAAKVFENIFLIDDFSGSGNSILRKDRHRFKGKLPRFVKNYLGTRSKPGKLGKCCSKEGPGLFILAYVSTQKAIAHLKEAKEEFKESFGDDPPNFAQCEILEPLQLIEDKEKVPQPDNLIDKEFSQLLEQYYDDRIEDEHTRTGGTDVKYGYAGCALPLVLCHNCPNNSVYLLWAESQETRAHPGLKALFPRIARHLEER